MNQWMKLNCFDTDKELYLNASWFDESLCLERHDDHTSINLDLDVSIDVKESIEEIMAIREQIPDDSDELDESDDLDDLQ